LIPILALLSNYDRGSCLINVGTEGVNGKCVQVKMTPGAIVTLEIGLKRYANKPTYAFPWHGGAVPVK
jgi:hypothetical protein